MNRYAKQFLVVLGVVATILAILCIAPLAGILVGIWLAEMGL